MVMKKMKLALIFIFPVLFTGCDDESTLVINGLGIRNNPTFGNVITDNTGRTLYFFSNDIAGNSTCEGNCSVTWKPFYVKDAVIEEGLNETEIGTITRQDGTKQNTYWRWPLYYFNGDTREGDTNGDKVNGVWYVAKPDYKVMVANLPNDGGKYLVAPKGRTLYTFTNDTNNSSSCNSESCVTTWPIFLNENSAVPSLLNASLFGVITRADNSKQSTYNSKPLYYFKDDVNRGQKLGEGVGNVWFTVKFQ
jgi:predicted lipoprotein with Yx(FWY)xxD motif